jgi:hypothetical protein
VLIARQATVPKSRRHGDAHGHILVAHRQLAFSSLDLLDLKAAFGQVHVEERAPHVPTSPWARLGV